MTTSAPKPKFDRAVAMLAAGEICNALKASCQRLIVAGSLRRGKQRVGDVEILYVSKTQTVSDGLFDTREDSLADREFEQLIAKGVLDKRTNVNACETWGEKNKLARHVATGVPVDLFAATEQNWWNYLVCRTGPAENNIRIAAQAKERGWQWHPYRSGFTDARGDVVPVNSEQDVFRLVGLVYRDPQDR